MSDATSGNHPAIELVRGDITRIPADVIVNAANEGLRGGGGVDGAIHRAGGPAVMADLIARYGVNRRCPTGSAVVSAAGNLPARWVIHAVGPVWRGGGAGEEAHLRSAYETSVHLADALGAQSLTFPALSCGVFGYPIDLAARVAIDAVRQAFDHADHLRRATFVLFSSETLEAFQASARGSPRD